MRTTYQVEGMSCAHCVQAVRSELTELAGVAEVDVDLPAGQVTVDSTVDDDALREAIAEAGYEVTGTA